MKRLYLAVAALIILACAVMPASAFTMKSLSITLAGNGDAQMDITYDLSLVEQTAVFFRLADPEAQLKSAFDAGGVWQPTVSGVSSSSAHLVIPSFASVNPAAGKTSSITTPSLSFEHAQAVLNTYWFAPLVSPDFSPGVTTITFPDGYRATYYEQIRIPSVTHQVSG